MNDFIPFNKPVFLDESAENLQHVCRSLKFSGNQEWTRKCESFITTLTGSPTLLTSSCTAALELCALLLDLKEGDEVIVPNFTFVSSASAFSLRGAKIIFVDIDRQTLNIDPKLAEEAITNKTKAIVLVHYAGIPCDFDAFQAIRTRGIKIIEDAAHCIGAELDGRQIGWFGDLATFSFHETKNITSGEGGALVVNNPSFTHRAEVIREKGTDRASFFRGEVDKYQWQELGSNYLMSEFQAAYLYPQLEQLPLITAKRNKLWYRYYNAFSNYTSILEIPHCPPNLETNGHIFFIRFQDSKISSHFIEHMRERGIKCTFHYTPLHQSPAGRKYGIAHGTLSRSVEISKNIVRLPIFYSLREEEINRVIDCGIEFLEKFK